MLEIPVPVAVLENLGLSISPQHSTRMLCEACFAKSLQGGKLDLLDLVQLAPDQVKQSLHAYLAHEFEI